MATTTPPAPSGAPPPPAKPASSLPKPSFTAASPNKKPATATVTAASPAKAKDDGAAKISALVKQAASLASSSSPKKTAPAPPQEKIKKDAQKSAKSRGGGGGALEPKKGDERSRKRSRVGDTKETVDSTNNSNDGKKHSSTDKDNDKQQKLTPFASLPFYGDHKRAISSLSFAPSSSLLHRGHNGNASLNSNAIIVAPVLCASSSADGSAKVWDITQHIHGIDARGHHRHRANHATSTNIDSTSTSTTNNNNNTAAANTKTKKKMYGATPSAFTSSSARLDPKLGLFGHNRGINDVTWSPTASYLATASDDKTLRLWSAETGDALVEFRGHTNFVFSCRFNPQSNLLVSGSFDETVKLWDVRCGECVATLPAHSNPVTGVDFNRDGTCIVSGSYDGLVRIWDTATGECLKTVYAEGNPPVGGVRFSPNGRFVLSGTLDSKLRLYDVSGGRERGTFGNEYRGLHTNRPQPRGGKCSKTYAGHQNNKFCAFAAFLSVNPKRQCIVSGSEDGKVHLYDLQSRLIRQTLEGHQDAVLAVDAHDSLELIGSGGMANDKHVRFWGPSAVEN